MQQLNEAVVNMEVQTIEADNFGWIVQQHQPFHRVIASDNGSGRL
jgi:hypothetical protein